MIHLITQKQADEMMKNNPSGKAQNPEEATDIFLIVDPKKPDKPENGSSSEGEKNPTSGSADGAEQKNSSQGMQAQPNEQETEGNTPSESGSSSSQDTGNNPKDAVTGKHSSANPTETEGEQKGSSASEGSTPESIADGSTQKGQEGSSSASPSSGGSKGSADSLQDSLLSSGGQGSEPENSSGSSSGSGQETDTGSCGNTAGNNSTMDGMKGQNIDSASSSSLTEPSSAQDSSHGTNGSLEKALEEAISQFSSEISGETFCPDQELINQMSEQMQKDLETLKREEQKAQQKKSAERIDLSVSSPFYSNVSVGYHDNSNSQEGLSEYYSIMNSDTKRQILNLQAAFRKIFHYKNGSKEYKSNGRIDVERYYGKKLTPNVFFRHTKPGNKADMAIVILLDQSGSMSYNREKVLRTTAVILSALQPFPDVKVKVVGFTSSGHDADYIHYSNRQWENNRKLIEAVLSYHPHGGTFLGHALRYSSELLKTRPESNKMFICITDGAPSSRYYSSHSQGIVDCKQAVTEIQKFADVIGIGFFETDSEEFRAIFGSSGIVLPDGEQLPKLLPKKMKKLLDS